MAKKKNTITVWWPQTNDVYDVQTFENAELVDVQGNVLIFSPEYSNNEMQMICGIPWRVTQRKV